MNNYRRYAALLALAACDPPPPAAPASGASAATSATATSASEAPAANAAPVPSASTATSTNAVAAPPPEALAFPGVTGPVSVDYIAYDGAKNRVWVPVGNAGAVFVLDVATRTFSRVDGFQTAEKEVRGQKRVMGPSAVTLGDGVAYIANRATSEVCTVDATTLKLGACLKLTVPTDGVAYVRKAKEVWVTTPRDHSLTILDASKPAALKPKTIVKTEGDPEGYAVDEEHGVFYTNLEDKDRTLAIDVTKHAVTANVASTCGSEGPRGIAVDGARGLVVVACTDGVRTFDAAHGLAPLSKIDVGAGTDNIDYDARTKNLTVGSGKVARVTVLRVGDKGELVSVGTAATADGARNAVADANGVAYVVDAKNGKLVVAHVTLAP